MKKILSFALLAGVCFASALFAQDSGKATIAVTKVQTSEPLKQKLSKDGGLPALERVQAALADRLAAAMKQTGKFEVVTRSDLDAVLAEQEFADSGNAAVQSMAGKLKGVDYVLTIKIDDFQDYVKSATFAQLEKTTEKRLLRLGLVANLIDVKTGVLKETVSVFLDQSDISEEETHVTENGKLNDSLIIAITQKASKRIAWEISYVVFPIRVIAVTGNIITLNYGEGSGIRPAYGFEVFAVGELLKDPDTGEILGHEEVPVGKISVLYVRPKFSTAKAHVNNGIAVGQIVRPDGCKLTPNEE